MVDEGGAYLLARLLIAIFGKKRASWGYAVFVSIILLAFAVAILHAESPQEATFSVVALIFILTSVIIDGIDFVRRHSIRDFHAVEDEIQFEDDI